VQEIFVQAGCRRNAVLHVSDIREYVTKYVTDNELKFRSQVRLDPQLHRAVYGKGNEDKEMATWDKIFGAIQAKMSPAYSIQFAGQSQPIIKKVFCHVVEQYNRKFLITKNSTFWLKKTLLHICSSKIKFWSTSEILVKNGNFGQKLIVQKN